jgi:hypothetical protein
VVNVVTRALVCLGHKSVTRSYRNSTAFGVSIDTVQLHCSDSGEAFYAAIAVSRTGSIALTGTVVLYRLS